MTHVTRTILVVVGAALLLPIASETTTSIGNNDPNTVDTTNEAPVCNSAEPNSCVNKSNASDQNYVYESPEIEWCRRRPSWRIGTNQKDGPQTETEDIISRDVWNFCQKLLNYSPDLKALTKNKYTVLSSTFNYERDDRNEEKWSDEDDETYYQLPVLERAVVKTIRECMDHDISSGVQSWSTTGTMKKSSVQLYRRRDGFPVMAVVENALSDEEAEAVQALAVCTRKNLPALFERRNFDYTEEGGGNDVIYLAGLLQMLAPGVSHQVMKTAHTVWKTAGWSDKNADGPTFYPVDGTVPLDYDYDDEDERLIKTKYSTKLFPNPLSDCGIRTTEHLSYDRWGGLGYHADSESDYTILIALSDPADYRGGYFSLCPEYDSETQENGGSDCDDKISIKPNRLSAIVFLSEMTHGVEDILTPGRVMFTNELWRYGHVPVMEMRPDPYAFLGIENPNGDDDYDDDDIDDIDDIDDDDDMDDDDEDDDEDDDDVDKNKKRDFSYKHADFD